MPKVKNKKRYESYGHRVAADRKSAAIAAADIVEAVCGVFLTCTTFVLNDMNYGEKGICNFVDKVNKYIDEFDGLANIEFNEKGITKHNSVKYAMSVFEKRRSEIAGNSLPVVKLGLILDNVAKRHQFERGF